jgi:hypothetical protein
MKSEQNKRFASKKIYFKYKNRNFILINFNLFLNFDNYKFFLLNTNKLK